MAKVKINWPCGDGELKGAESRICPYCLYLGRYEVEIDMETNRKVYSCYKCKNTIKESHNNNSL